MDLNFYFPKSLDSKQIHFNYDLCKNKIVLFGKIMIRVLDLQ